MATEQEGTRKLTAILSADVKGYSLLMTNDEASTIKTLKEYRKIMSKIITDHSGNVVDMPGDNIMADFSSVVNAVKSSVSIQKALKSKNDDLPHDKRLEFRIGINIGDVVQDGDSLYGEGVNIAARIEGLADPGGICISRGAYDHIRNKLNFGYEYIGEHNVKNIKNPVRVYKVLMESEDAGKLIGEKPQLIIKNWVWSTIVLAAIVLTLIGYQFYQKITAPEFKPASIEKMAFPLPEKPSIAVLPFNNLSGDPEQVYFSDGLTEEIITALSKVPKMFVIARNSTFTYKTKPIKVQQVAEDLGVRYVLEGSVRKDKEQVRITAQLIDALNGHHLWAERYDRAMSNIFAVQDEITMMILNALEVKLTDGEQAVLLKKGTNNLQVYLKLLQGIHVMHRANPENVIRSRRIFEKIVAEEPNYASAYTLLSRTYWLEAMLGAAKSKKATLHTGALMAQKSISIDDTQGTSYAALGQIYIMKQEWDKGIELLHKSIELEPNGAESNFYLGLGLNFSGRPGEGLPMLENAMRLNPISPPKYYNATAISYRMLGKFDKAIEYLEKGNLLYPDHLFSHLNLSACYILAGREKEAYVEAKEVLRLNPKFSVDKFANALQLRDQEEKKRFIGALRKAFSFQSEQ